jgi:hypothetical protein
MSRIKLRRSLPAVHLTFHAPPAAAAAANLDKRKGLTKRRLMSAFDFNQLATVCRHWQVKCSFRVRVATPVT